MRSYENLIEIAHLESGEIAGDHPTGEAGNDHDPALGPTGGAIAPTGGNVAAHFHIHDHVRHAGDENTNNTSK